MTPENIQKTEPGGQEYTLITILWTCNGCGCVVVDTKQHDKMHNKTRSVVN
jgi:hypothetical protein